MVRPEQVRVAPEPGGSKHGDLVGTIAVQIYMSPMTFCHVKVGETTLIAHRLGKPLVDQVAAFVSLTDGEMSFMPSQGRGDHG